MPPQHADSAPSEIPQVPRNAVVRHLILSAALWVTYVLYWRVVLQRGVAREAPISFLILAGFAVLQVGFTAAWIAHNRSLSKRHAGRRVRRPDAEAPEVTDFLGRSLEVPSEADLRHAPCVVVRVEDDRKVFDVSPPPPGFWSRGPS